MAKMTSSELLAMVMGQGMMDAFCRRIVAMCKSYGLTVDKLPVCPRDYCSAGPGEHCKSKKGKPRPPHKERVALGQSLLPPGEQRFDSKGDHHTVVAKEL